MGRKPVRVLIMDDAADNENDFLRMFASADELLDRYRLIMVRNRRQAVDRMSQQPEIALLDLRGRSDTEGLETARELNSMDERLKIVIMSSTDDGNPHVAAAALDEGFDFIEKSYVQTPPRMRLCLDMIMEQMHLAPPLKLLQAMAAQLSASVARPAQSALGDVEKFSLTPTERRVAWCYMIMPDAPTSHLAELLDMSEDGFKRTGTRLRNKVRAIRPDIPDGIAGRRAVVDVLQEMSLLNSG